MNGRQPAPAANVSFPSWKADAVKTVDEAPRCMSPEVTRSDIVQSPNKMDPTRPCETVIVELSGCEGPAMRRPVQGSGHEN